MMQAREAYAAQTWRGLFGSAAALRQLRVETDPLLPDPGWDAIAILVPKQRIANDA